MSRKNLTITMSALVAGTLGVGGAQASLAPTVASGSNTSNTIQAAPIALGELDRSLDSSAFFQTPSSTDVDPSIEYMTRHAVTAPVSPRAELAAEKKDAVAAVAAQKAAATKAIAAKAVAAQKAATAKKAVEARKAVAANTALNVSRSMNRGDIDAQRAALSASDLGPLVAYAKEWIGTPYAWGGGTPSGPTRGFAQGARYVGFDCSSFVQHVYAHFGYKLPRVAAAQQDYAVPTSSPQPGDLVFFGNPAHHVGIYLGDGMMIDAPHTGSFVGIHRVYSGVSGYGRIVGAEGLRGKFTGSDVEAMKALAKSQSGNIYVDHYESDTNPKTVIKNTAPNPAPKTVKPTDGSPATTKPTDGATSTVKPTDGSTATTKPTDGSTSTVKPTDGSTATTKPTDGSTSTVKPTDGSTATTKPTDGSTSTVKPTDGSTATTKPTDTTTTTTTPVSPSAGTTATSAPKETSTAPAPVTEPSSTPTK